MFVNSESETTNIWYVSDNGSDGNDCHSQDTPCANLQTVLDRAKDHAHIYVTSNILSANITQDYVWMRNSHRTACIVNSTTSYTLQSANNSQFEITCPGKF